MLWSNQMRLITICLWDHPPHILQREMSIKWQLPQSSRELIIKNSINPVTSRSPRIKNPKVSLEHLTLHHCTKGEKLTNSSKDVKGLRNFILIDVKKKILFMSLVLLVWKIYSHTYKSTVHSGSSTKEFNYRGSNRSRQVQIFLIPTSSLGFRNQKKLNHSQKGLFLKYINIMKTSDIKGQATTSFQGMVIMNYWEHCNFQCCTPPTWNNWEFKFF